MNSELERSFLDYDASILFRGNNMFLLSLSLRWANRMRGLKDQDYVISTVGEPDSVDTAAGRWIMMPFMNSGSSLERKKAGTSSDQAFLRPPGLVYGLL